jgi:pimeloyl-[acyl-carrier protein] methyl ester esterase
LRLVFVHGWAFAPNVWDALAALLPEFAQARADLGFFGPPALPDPAPGDILVGHSAGLLWGLRARRDWAGVVAINSFSRFTLDAQGRGCVRPAALRAMQRELAQDAQACVEQFRAAHGAPPAPGVARPEALAEGLALLRDFDAGPLLHGRPMLILSAEDDALAPPAAARELAALSGGRLALSAKGGHGLPWMATDFCARAMREFLGEL